MNNSRKMNTLYNFTSSIGGQVLTIIMQFLVRTAFIHHLGKSYLGINGLFSNILSMLSLAELGVGSAIIYKLYDPIAKDDHKRITILMRFYKDVYRVIGIVVAVIGVCLIPILPNLIKDYDSLKALNINTIFIFILYLIQNVSSYLFLVYKSALINANQKAYLVNLVSYIFTVLSGLIQIACLSIFGIFEIYVIIQVVQIIAQNIACGKLADKLYPYINDKNDDKLSRSEAKEVFKDCGALFLYKVNGVVVKSTDNIILSMYIGLDMVAMYSNYNIFYTTIKSLFNKIFDSVSHSLGNLHTSKDLEHEYDIFRSVMLIAAILGGTSFVGVAIVSNELIDVWIGNDWVLMQPFAFLMGLELFTAPFKNALNKYRTTMGLFQQAKYRPVAGMTINLVVSVLLVKNWGICGVLIGTIASDWLTFMWFDPLIIYKYGFANKFESKKYFYNFLKYFAVSCVVCFIAMIICNNICVGMGVLSIIVHTLICGIIVPFALIISSVNTTEGKYVINLCRNYMNKIINR